MDNNLFIKFATLNVKGLRNYEKRQKLFHWAKTFDIVALQETFFTKDLETRLNREWSGFSYHSYSDSTHSRGVSILINDSLQISDIMIYSDSIGRLIMLDFKHKNDSFSLINVYAPTDASERKIFLTNLDQKVKLAVQCYSIVCGDFNTVYRAEDRMSKNLDQTSIIFKEFIKGNNLTDLWCTKNAERQQFSFISTGNNKMQSRIDYFLSNQEVDKYCKKCFITNAPAPDHKAVIMHMSKDNKDIGKGYWKLNNSILTENMYKEGIKTIFRNTIREFENIGIKALIWDMCKIRFREFSISYCTKKKKAEEGDIGNIENRLDRIDFLLADANLRDEMRCKLYSERKSLKNKMDIFYANKARGGFIRSRANWIEEGEKSSKYFLNLEKSRQENNLIQQLFCSDEQRIVNDAEHMLKTAKQYYQKLYQDTDPNDNDINNYLDRIRFKNILTNVENIKCEGVITLNECTEVIKDLKKNKSPGLDGLSCEFYQTFWHSFGYFLVEVYNESYENGILPVTVRKSVLGLIYKKGEKELLKNYRPISLTNTDYKILAFVLSSRLHQVIGKVIEPRQSAYVKKRYIGNNIRLVEDIIQYTDYENKGGCILFLDFQKAFDSVEWKFMFNVLKRFNFGETFIQWVKLLYKKPEASVKINGYLSDTFKLKRGVRQGCPVSALIFLLVVEVMALDIENDPNIKGISIKNNTENDIQIKVTQYADDTIIFLDNPNDAIKTLEYLNKFSKVSGLNLNKDKTEGIKLGTDKQKNFENEIKWVTHTKCLGIMIGHDNASNDIFNWKEKLSKIKNVLLTWKARDLTQIGKITVIKSLLVSKIIFTFMNVDIRCEYLNELNDIIFQFLWPKKQWIERSVMINSLVEGGLNMIDIYAKAESIQAKRIDRLLNNKDEIWTVIPMYYYKQKLGLGDYWANMKTFDKGAFNELFDKIPAYYLNALISFSRLKSLLQKREYQNENGISLNEPIWLNDLVLWKGKPIYFPNWIKAGLFYLKDIIDIANDGRHVLNLTKIHFLVNPTNLLIERNVMHNVIRNLPMLKNDTILNEPRFETSLYYDMFKNQNSTTPRMAYWKRTLQIPNKLQLIFKRKVLAIKEKKLRAFNFKLVHGILIHGSKVNKWDKSIPYDCQICFQKHTIEHMVFECSLAKYILHKCKLFTNTEIISIEDIIFGVESKELNYILTFATFTLYKYWLKSSKENQTMNIGRVSDFFNKELCDQCAVLELTTLNYECGILKQFMIFCINS